MKQYQKLLSNFNIEYLTSGKEFISLLKSGLLENQRLNANKRFKKARVINIFPMDKIKSAQCTYKYITNSSKWKEYRKEVWRITNTQNLSTLEHIERRSFKDYHIDHKISIWYGYKNNIEPSVIGGISNLRMIPAKDNMLKGRKANFD